MPDETEDWVEPELGTSHDGSGERALRTGTPVFEPEPGSVGEPTAKLRLKPLAPNPNDVLAQSTEEVDDWEDSAGPQDTAEVDDWEDAPAPISAQPVPAPPPEPSMLHKLADKVWPEVKNYFGAGRLDDLNEAKNKYGVPAVQTAQKYVGRPLANVALDLTSNPGTENAALMRTALSTYAGEVYASEDQAATAKLEATLGPKWAGRATVAADMLGQAAPMLLAPNVSGVLGASARAGALARMGTLTTTSPKLASLMALAAESVGSAAGAFVEGAGIGAAQSTTSKDKRIEESALHAGKSAAVFGAAVPIVKTLAVATYKGVRELASELATWSKAAPEVAAAGKVAFDPAKPESWPQDFSLDQLDAIHQDMAKQKPATALSKTNVKPIQLTNVADGPARTTLTDPTFQPGLGTVLQRPDGKLAFNVGELNPKAQRYAQITLETPLDFFKAGEVIKKHNIFLSMPDEILTNLGPLEANALMYGFKIPNSVQDHFREALAEIGQVQMSERSGSNHFGNYSPRDKTPTSNQRLPPPSLDATFVKPEPQLVIQAENGVVKVRPHTLDFEASNPEMFNRDNQVTRQTRSITESNAPAGGMGKAGQTQEIKATYAAMNKIDKLKDPAGFARAQEAYFLATNQSRPATIPELIPPKPQNVAQPHPDFTPDYVLDEVKQTADLARVMMQTNAKAGNKSFLAGFLADHSRGPEDLRQLVSAMNGANAVGKPGEVLRAVRAEMPKKALYDAAASDLNQVALGKGNLDQFIAKHPEVSSHMMQTTRSLLEEIQQNSKQLEEMGYISEGLSAARDTGRIDQYVANMYRAHYMGKGQWAKLRTASDGFLDDIEFLHRQNPTWSKGQVAHEALEILQSEDPLGRFQMSGLNKPMNNLKARTQIPEQIRKMLGEETSGPMRIAVTVSNQRAILRKLQVWNEVVQSPYWHESPTAKHTIKLDGPKKMFGNAAGGYVSPELAPLISAHKAPDNSLAFMDAIGGLVKGNQVVLGGVKPWVNNIMRNIKGSVLAGGLDLARPMESMTSVGEAIAQLRAWHASPTVGSKGALVLEARQAGALASGLGRNELSPGSDKLYSIMAEEMGKSGELFSGLAGVRKRLEKLNLPKEKLSTYYDAIDTTFKFTNYLSLRKKFLREGMTVEQAARTAADRINNSFPNFEHVGTTVEKLRKNPFGAVAPYLTSNVEDIRVNALVARRLKSEPDLKWRLLGTTAFTGGLVGMFQTLREANGISKKDVEEADLVRSKSSQYYRPGAVASPFRDSQGRVQFYDLGSWLPELQLAQGMPDDPLFNRISTNLFMTPLQGSVWEAPAREVLNKVGAVRRPPNWTPRTTEGERGAWESIAPFFEPALPGAVPSTVETLRRGGVVGKLGRNEEQLTGSQMFQRMAGMPLAGPVSQPSRGPSKVYQGNTSEYIRELKDLKGQMISIQLSQKSDADKAALMRAVGQRMQELQQRQSDISSSINQNRR